MASRRNQAWKVMSGSSRGVQGSGRERQGAAGAAGGGRGGRERQALSPLRGGPLGGENAPERGELGWPPGRQRLEEPKLPGKASV